MPKIEKNLIVSTIDDPDLLKLLKRNNNISTLFLKDLEHNSEIKPTYMNDLRKVLRNNEIINEIVLYKLSIKTVEALLPLFLSENENKQNGSKTSKIKKLILDSMNKEAAYSLMDAFDSKKGGTITTLSLASDSNKEDQNIGIIEDLCTLIELGQCCIHKFFFLSSHSKKEYEKLYNAIEKMKSWYPDVRTPYVAETYFAPFNSEKWEELFREQRKEIISKNLKMPSNFVPNINFDSGVAIWNNTKYFFKVVNEKKRDNNVNSTTTTTTTTGKRKKKKIVKPSTTTTTTTTTTDKRSRNDNVNSSTTTTTTSTEKGSTIENLPQQTQQQQSPASPSVVEVPIPISPPLPPVQWQPQSLFHQSQILEQKTCDLTKEFQSNEIDADSEVEWEFSF